MAQLEAEINALSLIVEWSDIDHLVSDAKSHLERKLKTHDELFASWTSANSIREEHKRRYEASIGFCVKQLPSAGYATYLVLFNALLLGMDPKHAEPFQVLSMPLAAQLVRRIPYELWLSTPMATSVRPAIPGLRRVTPERRNEFIKTALVPDSTILERLQHDSNSPDLHKILAKALKRRRR